MVADNFLDTTAGAGWNVGKHGRVNILAEEFAPEGYERAQLFRAELLSHFSAFERDTKEDCRRIAELRRQVAESTGDAAGAKAAAEIAALIAEGRVE